MRTIIAIICLSLTVISCNNSNKEKEGENYSETSEYNDQVGQTGEDRSQVQNQDELDNESIDTETGTETSKSTSATISGTYYNTEHREDSGCDCYCLEVTTTGTSKLCLKENELYIDARFQQNGGNLEIYYSGKAAGSTDSDIPWNEFETGTPIAVLSPVGNGSMKLDWKGFSIDGKIAVDYALYGKKTLEGTYKKK